MTQRSLNCNINLDAGAPLALICTADGPPSVQVPIAAAWPSDRRLSLVFDTLTDDSPTRGGADLSVYGPNAHVWHGRITIPSSLNEEGPTIELTPGYSPFSPRRLSAGEHGRLRFEGRFAYTDTGVPWNWRGASMFRLPRRMYLGEDITPTLEWCVTHNINVLRVWPFWTGGVDPGALWGSVDPLYLQFLRDQFYPRLLAYGLRSETTVVTEYDWSWDTRRRALAVMFELLSEFDLCVAEAENEPWNRGDDVQALLDGINRHGVPSAFGICPINGPGEVSFTSCPHLEIVTPHLGRDNAEGSYHYTRNGKELQEMWGLNGFLVDDECLGVAEYERTGAGARTNDLQAVLSHYGVARLYGGATLHSQFGLEGRMPSAAEPISELIATRVGELWAAIPDDVYRGAYARAGHGDFPFSNVTKATSFDGHAYASIFPHEGYVVIPQLLDPDFVPECQGDWSTWESIGPSLGVYRVTR